MLDDTPGQEPATETTNSEPGAAAPEPTEGGTEESPPAKKTTRKATTKKATAKKASPRKAASSSRTRTSTQPTVAVEAEAGETPATSPDAPAEAAAALPGDDAGTATPPGKKTTSRRRPAKATASPDAGKGEGQPQGEEPAETAAGQDTPGAAPLFQAPDASQTPARSRRSRRPTAAAEEPAPTEEPAADDQADDARSAVEQDADRDPDSDEGGESGGRRRRRRGGRRRRKSGGDGDGDAADGPQEQDATGGKTDQQDGTSRSAGGKQPDSGDKDDEDKDGESSSSRRRRRRRRSGDGGGDASDDPQNTVTRVRQGRTGEDQITSLSGSTRLEAKKQRRREGREAGRRRAPIVSEAEFLARRESVDRVMAIRQREDLTQIAVLEDKVLVEHYVARESQTSLIGNVYLGRVQNVLPSMEAAFIDIGKGRNAVLYAGEVNWTALGHQDGQPRKIESVLSSGQTVMVQVTKDPVGHKGARLTSQISLAGRFLVYVPDGTNSGISRKLPDTERNRLKTLLKEIVPDGAGVIVRTAAEGASEEELTLDVERLTTRWATIEKKAKGSAPQLLYGEPDLTLKVVRDLFTEDFAKLVVQGDDAWETVSDYVGQVAPDLEARLEKHDPEQGDLFTTYRIDEQIAKGLDRKVWLPSGGSLIIDRTEAMTVVDVNTGKFTGSGGNLEETVTKNNLEAAEEMVRQLRLRDIGGIIVIDFIDMVLESNRDLVLRRLVECLGRDRTRHQVAEVTSLGLVQMTRKRIGTGLLEAFSESCTHCNGRGVIISETPVEPSRGEDEPRRSRRSRGGRGRNGDSGGKQDQQPKLPSPKDVAAMARPPRDETAEPTERTPDAGPETPAEAPTTDGAPVPEVLESEEAAEEPAAGEQTSADETPGTPAPEEATAADAAVAEPAPAEQPDTPRPAVVTRSRRRSARRPAGPPAGSSPASPPPGAVGSVGEPPGSGVVEPGTAESEPPAVSHVPVKKRGSRKR